MSEEPQIIAMGGLIAGAGDLALFRYVLQQASRPTPRVAYIGTASGDADAFVARFYESFARLDCQTSHLPLFRRTPDLETYFREQDVILVGGGNTRSMLAVWRDWGLPELLREAWGRGTVLAGWSAGALCWFEQGVTDSGADELSALTCLGFLPGSCCPHYDGEVLRRPTYHELLGQQRIAPGIAIDDGAAVHFWGTTPKRILAVREQANAYEARLEEGSVVERTLPVERVLLNAS